MLLGRGCELERSVSTHSTLEGIVCDEDLEGEMFLERYETLKRCKQWPRLPYKPPRAAADKEMW